ncbi:hypothetical protein [Leucobacter aridicollis]|uniref:hypothetical protein n=1 Tax=Leucobacter aridicollis TaxID=283878 RepID=UPI002104E175|nr:hypothetical protein [Leucobacter aridicollis]UTX54296.1 hypothetical protein KI794_06230 [Leucobacter aridicollis]
MAHAKQHVHGRPQATPVTVAACLSREPGLSAGSAAPGLWAFMSGREPVRAAASIEGGQFLNRGLPPGQTPP